MRIALGDGVKRVRQFARKVWVDGRWVAGRVSDCQKEVPENFLTKPSTQLKDFGPAFRAAYLLVQPSYAVRVPKERMK